MRWIAALLLTVSSLSAWGWGAQGHMIVGQVAQNNLSKKAQTAVDKVLRGFTLAEVANWADVIKGDARWAHTKPWHFVDIPDGEDYSTVEHSHEGDIVTAITDMVQVLKSRTSSATDKENALKFIVHFVGDMHQPLHVGRPEDRGGNSTRVVFEGRNTNLHALWDSILIAKTPMDYQDYADSLEPKRLPAPYDIPEMAFSQVIDECMGARPDIYNFRGRTGNPIVIDLDYYNRNVELMNAQLLAGGKRLAKLLNTLYK